MIWDTFVRRQTCFARAHDIPCELFVTHANDVGCKYIVLLLNVVVEHHDVYHNYWTISSTYILTADISGKRAENTMQEALRGL